MFEVLDRVKFTKPDTDFESDKIKAGKFLVLDAVYTVGKIQNDGSFIGVFLNEVPDQRFNADMFEPAYN